MRKSALHHFCLFYYLAIFLMVCIRDSQQHPFEAGTSILLARGEISAAIEWLAIRRKKGCERPSTLSTDCADGGLIAAIDVGTFIAIHLHCNKTLIDDLREFSVVIGFAIHHMAPMAPHCANVQQDRFVLPLRRSKSFFSPLVPLHRLMHRRAQVR